MGTISGLAYFVIAYEVWLGGAKNLQKLLGQVLESHKMLCWFVLVGWSIYPLGYMIGTDGWYDFVNGIRSIWILFTTSISNSIPSEVIL